MTCEGPLSMSQVTWILGASQVDATRRAALPEGGILRHTKEPREAKGRMPQDQAVD